MNRTQFGNTVPHLSREEKGDQQLCQKPLLQIFVSLSGRELCNICLSYAPHNFNNRCTIIIIMTLDNALTFTCCRKQIKGYRILAIQVSIVQCEATNQSPQLCLHVNFVMF